jgi:hypothetical protein
LLAVVDAAEGDAVDVLSAPAEAVAVGGGGYFRSSAASSAQAAARA